MNKNDARNFIVALNNCQPYVPPLLYALVTANPCCQFIERIGNAPDETATPPGDTPAKLNGSGVNPNKPENPPKA